MTAPALLLVAHGSRDPRHAATVRALCGRVRELRPGTPVRAGFLDHCAPTAGQAVDRFADEGVTAVVAVPLLLTRAFHADHDVPSVLAEAAGRHPGVAIGRARVLGPSALLVDALERRLREAGASAADRGATGVVLAAAGSSNPAAVASVADVARRWRRRGGWCAVRPAFAAALPRTGDVVRGLRADGVRRVLVAPYLLAPGFLPDRIGADAAAAGADLVAAPLGDAPEVARVVLERYDAACPVGAGRLPA